MGWLMTQSRVLRHLQLSLHHFIYHLTQEERYLKGTLIIIIQKKKKIPFPKPGKSWPICRNWELGCLLIYRSQFLPEIWTYFCLGLLLNCVLQENFQVQLPAEIWFSPLMFSLECQWVIDHLWKSPKWLYWRIPPSDFGPFEIVR